MKLKDLKKEFDPPKDQLDIVLSIGRHMTELMNRDAMLLRKGREKIELDIATYEAMKGNKYIWHRLRSDGSQV
jgi:hypothetical protein